MGRMVMKFIATSIFNTTKPCCHCDNENTFLKSLDRFDKIWLKFDKADAKTEKGFERVRQCVKDKLKNGCKNHKKDNNLQDGDILGGGSSEDASALDLSLDAGTQWGR